ncbi:ATP-grasp domain-containing protein [Streptomyces sp. NBC_01190]|uniref:ATP-grasp domain-containing protein n=1 Tax=Streptomyces sp. NBC_01190 TaxID=2903767 RepID=UPI00386C2638|nr:ATP-grasp domain-containing protein [Streptomyces sp. NBC_01190]
MTISVLLCNDPLGHARCDPHFAAQAAAVRRAGAEVALVDHDALLRGDTEGAVRRVPRGMGAVWYRGWMVPAGAYAELGAALAERGVHLLTSPTAYRVAHELPGWYGTFARVTPASAWIPCPPGRPPGPQALARAAARLPPGAGIVKDFVKSRKHKWDEACYLPDLADIPAVHAVVSRFVELQEDSLAGGVVLRAFEHFRRDVGEARIWWLDADPVLTTGHPDTPGLRPTPPLEALRPLVRALGCRFITTDLTQRTDGTWRVIEVGDGQVSDLTTDTDPAILLAPLLTAAPTPPGWTARRCRPYGPSG